MKGQLFTWTSEEEGVRLCRDAQWVAQQKFDGTRCLVDLRLPEPRFIARHGGPLKHSACAVHFADITADLLQLVDPGRRLVFLEGGYDLEAIAESAAGTVGALLGERIHPEAPSGGGPGGSVVSQVAELRRRFDR